MYAGRRLSHQIVPLQGLQESAHAALLEGGTRLAEAYRALGYRGHLSADALVLPSGEVVFTEVNAQVSGSLRIYQQIAHRIVDITAAPPRQVVEYHVPPTWAVPGWDAFMATVRELGLAYDPDTRTGVVVSMPAIAAQPGGPAQFVFCIAHDHDRDPADGASGGHAAMFDRLDARWATVPACTYDASHHLDTGTGAGTGDGCGAGAAVDSFSS